MGEKRFFADIADIRERVPLKLEQLLKDSPVSVKEGKLFFTYWLNMEPWEDKPLLVDNEGQFWIGKNSSGSNLLFEEYGRNMSEFLGCPSPEVDYDDSNGKPLVLSKFIHPSRGHSLEELKARGQVTIVSRLLAAYSRKITDNQERLSGRLDCDINLHQFLIDSQDVFYQFDFSRPVGEILYFTDVKLKLNVFGLTADPDNEIIKRQIAQLRQCSFEELYKAYTKKSCQIFPDQTKNYLSMFLWNFNNIDRLLYSLHMANGYRPIRLIIHPKSQDL
ncbi:hypothetical protein J4204_01050 [Candidatus Woesearchaeota archaeon]|nr:hypothetical protein [Candidatus Woesearchaeota archaeon]